MLALGRLILPFSVAMKNCGQKSKTDSPATLLAGLRLLFLLLGIAWLLLAVWILAGGGVGIPPRAAFWWLAAAGLIGDAAAHWLTAWGLGRRPRPFALVGAAILLANAGLIVLDQMGIWEYLLMIVHLVGLGMIWRVLRSAPGTGS